MYNIACGYVKCICLCLFIVYSAHVCMCRVNIVCMHVYNTCILKFFSIFIFPTFTSILSSHPSFPLSPILPIPYLPFTTLLHVCFYGFQSSLWFICSCGGSGLCGVSSYHSSGHPTDVYISLGLSSFRSIGFHDKFPFLGYNNSYL